MKIFKKSGILCLSIWLIATGLIPLMHFHFKEQGRSWSVLAIAAGVLLLIGR